MSASGDNDISSFGPGQHVKTPRSERFTLRLLVPTKAAGSLIGKGGANIRTLRDDPQCSARVPECSGPERVFSVSHVTMSACLAVMERALEFLTDDAVNRTIEDQIEPKDPADQSLEIRLLVNQSIIGGIIGHGGDKIQNVRDVSGAKLRIFREPAPGSSDRAVMIKGTLSKVRIALNIVVKEIETCEVKIADSFYNPSNFSESRANEYGGWYSEADQNRHPSSSRHSNLDGNGMSPFLGRSSAGGGGGPDSVHSRSYGARYSQGGGQADYGPSRRSHPPQRSGGRAPPPSASYGGFHTSRSPYGRTGSSRGGGGAPSAPGSPFANAYELGAAHGGGMLQYPSMSPAHAPPLAPAAVTVTEKTAVTITKEMAGAIIGVAGSRIRDIREHSRAAINIGDPIAGTEERVVTITGSKEQIDIAQYLMQGCVKENSHAHSVGPGLY